MALHWVTSGFLGVSFFWLIYHVLFKWVQIITGIELPCEVELGRNFIIDHFGGVIISGYAKFGDDCRIRNGVVVGLRHIEDKRAPIIGNNVDVGAGAKILGLICSIGNNVLDWCKRCCVGRMSQN